ncbi:MAG: hypothetical protein ACE5JC_04840 [Candidatus Zixiibacteriota bacterium]
MVETYADRLAVIRYHQGPSDPYCQYNPSENSLRRSYYGQPSNPRLFVDGSDAGDRQEVRCVDLRLDI